MSPEECIGFPKGPPSLQHHISPLLIFFHSQIHYSWKKSMRGKMNWHSVAVLDPPFGVHRRSYLPRIQSERLLVGMTFRPEQEKQKPSKSRLLKRQGASEKSHFVQRGPGALGVSERSGARLIYGPWPLMDAATVNEETPTGPA